jgi:hypothetical protein
MNEEHVSEVWMLFKQYTDKKQLEIAAEKYLDLLADQGVSDIVLQDAMGMDAVLDDAIVYYLDLDTIDEED